MLQIFLLILVIYILQLVRNIFYIRIVFNKIISHYYIILLLDLAPPPEFFSSYRSYVGNKIIIIKLRYISYFQLDIETQLTNIWNFINNFKLVKIIIDFINY